MITDVLCMVVALVLCTLGLAPLLEIGKRLITVFLSALALGTLVGVGWVALLPGIRGLPFFHTLLLGTAPAAYVLAEEMGISGGISVLALGLAIGNARRLGEAVEREVRPISPETKRFHSEMAFLIRTFFLVYLGAMMNRGILHLLPHSCSSSWRPWPPG